MLEKFNNIWVILLSILLLYVIVRKIINLNKPFDEKRFIQQYKNQLKLKKQLILKIYLMYMFYMVSLVTLK